VQIGKEVHVSFALVAARLARVSGSVLRADGSPLTGRGSVSLNSRNPGSFGRGAPVQPNGTFTIADVPPGDYSLQASLTGTSPADRELGRISISVNGDEINGVIVTTSQSGSVRGRITFDGEPPSNVRLTNLQTIFTMAPPPSGVATAATYAGVSTLQEDGTFVINGVFDQGYLRVVSPVVSGWYLKSVTLGGKDVTDTPVSVVAGAELSGFEILMTQKAAEISGGAGDAKGPVSDYTVVIFPDDRSQWTPASRFIATARPDQQGRFRITGLPGGKYLAAAVEYLETGSERDPDLLGRLRERATAIALVDGEARTVTLSIQ
jgi:hypothetical protein